MFRVRARNKHGWGEFSAAANLLAAEVPDAPNTVTTTQDGLNIVVSWNKPAGNGDDTITSYEIQFEDNVGAYHTTTDCDGTDSTIITNLQCSVPY